jgi:hypothetical protein
MRTRLWPALLIVAAVGGCSGCDQGPAVPFKLSTAQRGSYEDSQGKPGAAAGPATAAAARAGVSFAAGTTQVELGGRKLALSGGAIRAAVEAELDGEAPAELLLVSEDASGRAVLAHAHQDDRGWAPPEPIAEAEAGDLCTLQAARLEVLDASYAVATGELDCPLPSTSAAPEAPAEGALPGPPDPPDPDAPATKAPGAAAPDSPGGAAPGAPPDGAGPSQRERRLWIVALERVPRLVERIAAAVPDDEAALRVEPALQSRDLDGDGHSDLVLGLSVMGIAPALRGGAPGQGGGQPPARVDVELLSRAGGLAPSGREPEAALLALADRAKAERKGNAMRAGETARQALALHGALCRESGTALLRIGGEQGLACGASLAAGRAASVQAAVLAAQGRVLDAIAWYEALRRPMYRLTDNDWERARVALTARADASGYEFRTGPVVTAPPVPNTRRSAIAFLDEQRLLLRGNPAQSYDIASGELAPVGIAGDIALADPSGRYALRAIERSCQGYQLAIVETAGVALGVAVGPNASEPLIAAAPPPAGAHCPQLTPEQRRDTGGFRALAWTAQGVVLERGQALWLLALDASARAAQPAVELAAGAAIGGLPPHSSELSPDGRYHAIATPLGVAVHDRKLGSTRLVALPADSASASDVAVSPSGRVIAVVRAGRVLVGVPRPQQATAAAGPGAAANVGH